MLLFALGIAKTLDLRGGDDHGSVLSLCAAQAGPGQAAGDVGLSLAAGAPGAGAGWERATKHFVKGKKRVC